MRKKIIAANWKMNLNINETIDFILNFKDIISNTTLNCEIVICPPFTSLTIANELLKNSNIKLGAQNMHHEKSGAFTGEISCEMLKNMGCTFVIIGHSERRIIFKETDELINKKILVALQNNLTPIFCVGETLTERETNKAFDVIKKQITVGLQNISINDGEKIVIAYEPVWAIGTGKNATKEEAEEVHLFIRNLLKEIFNEKISEKIVIQYGGSVKGDNAMDLLSQKNIDGALVGGASLKAATFFEIIKNCG